jgi:hypothetical protein
VELYHLTHDAAPVESFIVKDRRRTPEDWAYKSRSQAEEKFAERVRNAETQPPILPR